MQFVRAFSTLLLLAAAGRAQFLPDVRVSPSRIIVGSGDTTLTVSGANFQQGVQVFWNGQPRPSTFVSAWTLKVLISSADLVQPGLSWVSLWNPDQASVASNQAPVLIYLPLKSVDLVSDPSRGLIYASLAAADANGPSVAVIDPAKGIVQRYMPLPAEPSLMALSDGSRYLYVALADRIRRVDLTGATADLDIPFTQHVDSILPLPGDGTSFVTTFGFSNYSAIAYDGATKRPNQSNDAPQCLVGVNGSALYGGPGYRLLRLDANGMPFSAEVSIVTFLTGTSCPSFAGGLLYGSGGDIVDPNGPARVGRFGASGVIDVLPQRDQVYILNSANLNLVVFDATSHAQTGSTPLPITTARGRLIDWGTDGLAFGEYSNSGGTLVYGLYILHTAQLSGKSSN